MGDGQEVADPGGSDEQDPLLSGGGSPIEEEEEDESPSLDLNMTKTRAVDAAHPGSVPLYEDVDLDSAALRAQGHEAVLKRSFSPLAALGLGFRQVVYSITISDQLLANELLQYNQLMGWIPELLRAEPRIWGPSERRLRAPGCYGRSMDHHFRAF